MPKKSSTRQKQATKPDPMDEDKPSEQEEDQEQEEGEEVSVSRVKRFEETLMDSSYVVEKILSHSLEKVNEFLGTALKCKLSASFTGRMAVRSEVAGL